MKVGVIGAGTMGQGIAKAFAQTEGFTVALCDIKQEWADKGKDKIAAGYAKLVAKGKLDEAGKAAITGCTGSHADFGLLQYKMGPFGRFWNMLGYSTLSDNPDSWEGWHWGATHAWGYYWKLGISDNFDMLEEALKYTDMLLFWGVDPNTSAGGYNGQDGCRWRWWCKELGMEMIFIDPWCNYTAAVWGGWFSSPTK